jgi:phage protein D
VNEGVDFPAVYIRVGPPAPGAGGRADGAKLVDETVRILSLRFEDDEQKPDKLMLSIDNYDLSHLNSSLWKEGNVIEFQYGYVGRMSPPRTAVIQKVNGFTRLNVEAQSADVLMNRLARPERVFKQMKRSDVVREIVKAYGYSDDQLRIEDSGDVLEQITQGPFTDYQLIRQLAWKQGWEFWIDSAGVHFGKRPLDRTPSKTLRYFTEPGKGELLGEPSIELDVSPGQQKVGAVTMRGRDPVTGKPFEVRADDASTTDRTVLQPSRTVQEVLVVDAAGQVTTRTEPGVVNGTELVTPTTETTEAGAQKQATAHYAKLQMRAIKLGVPLRGDPNFAAKTVFRMEAIGAYSGLYYARNVVSDVNPGAVFRQAVKATTDGRGSGAGGGPGGAPANPPASGNPNPGGGGQGSGEMEEVIVVDSAGQSRTEHREKRGRGG